MVKAVEVGFRRLALERQKQKERKKEKKRKLERRNRNKNGDGRLIDHLEKIWAILLAGSLS